MSVKNMTSILDAFENDYFERAITAMVNDLSLWMGVKRMPVFVLNTGDEGYIMDSYSKKKYVPPTSDENREREALYQFRPRVVLDIEGVTFNQDEMTSGHEQAEFSLNLEGGERQYRAKVKRIPMEVHLGLQLITDNLHHALKNMEILMQIMCRPNAFRFQYQGRTYDGAYSFNWSIENVRNLKMQNDTSTRNRIVATDIILELAYPNFEIFRKYPAYGMPPPWDDSNNDGSFGNGLDPDPDKNTGENGGITPDPDVEDITDPDNMVKWIHYVIDKNDSFETKTVYDGIVNEPIPVHDTIKPPPRDED